MARDVDTGTCEANDAFTHPYWIYYSIQFKILHCSTLQLKRDIYSLNKFINIFATYPGPHPTLGPGDTIRN